MNRAGLTIKHIFHETGIKLREKKKSKSNERGTARLSPRVLKVCEEKPSGVVVRELVNFLIWQRTADTGNRIFERWLVGMVSLWIHGSLALSMVKAVEKLLLKIVALEKRSVLIFPSGDLSGTEVRGLRKIEFTYL